MSEEGHSLYSQINESQERMLITDIYIFGPIGLTVSIIILYSLIITNHKLESGYYKIAIKCGISLSITSIFWYLLQLLFNDLIIPNDKYIQNNVDIVSLFDSIMLVLFLMIKLSLYYGFTFIYLFLFKKNHINICLKIMIIFAFISTLVYGLSFFVDDILAESFREISVTQKRGIIIASIVNASNSSPLGLDIIAIIAILTDLIYIGVLIYYFISGAKQMNKYYSYGIKGSVLLTISSVSFIINLTIFVSDIDAKFLWNNIPIIIDTVCLYLMFNHNDDIYNNLCGCLFGKCCGSLCFGSKYQPLSTSDDEQENHHQLVV